MSENIAIVYIKKTLDEGSNISTTINFINVKPEEAEKRFIAHEDVTDPSDWEKQTIEFNDEYSVFGNPIAEFNNKLEGLLKGFSLEN